MLKYTTNSNNIVYIQSAYSTLRNEMKWYFGKQYFAKWYFAKWYFAKRSFAKLYFVKWLTVRSIAKQRNLK